MKEIDEIYTRKEVDDLKAWFDRTPLPKSLRLDKAVFIPDVKKTVDRLFGQAYVCFENSKLLGGLNLLEKIKAKIEEGEA